MVWMFEVMLGVCLIILCSGLVNYFSIRARKGYPNVKHSKVDDDDMEVLYRPLGAAHDGRTGRDDRFE